jgi:hypothetical protein
VISGVENECHSAEADSRRPARHRIGVESGNVRRESSPALSGIPLDLGCSLEHGAFERRGKSIKISTPDEA